MQSPLRSGLRALLGSPVLLFGAAGVLLAHPVPGVAPDAPWTDPVPTAPVTLSEPDTLPRPPGTASPNDTLPPAPDSVPPEDAGVADPDHAGLRVDREQRSISMEATLQADAFLASTPPDHQYHGLVYRGGSAAAKALFVTEVPDSTIARVLRELGAEDGGGVPMSSWNLRWVPLVPQPASRVQGTRLHVTVAWPGATGVYRLDELLDDRGGEGIEIRFGGNEEHDHHWDSGCILCLFSCPGGVMSNAAYTIRDHQRGVTTFDPGDRLPPDGTRVTLTFTLSGG